jgi:hypothetical protein
MTDLQLWWLALGLAAVVVVVVAVLLGLIIATAKSIDYHASAIWVAGKKIAGNTVSIWMLESANTALRGIHSTLDALQTTVAALNETLAGQAKGRR